MEYVNSDVVNTFGNLLSRCTASAINRDQIYPRKDQDTYISSITAADRETFENIEILIGNYLYCLTKAVISNGDIDISSISVPLILLLLYIVTKLHKISIDYEFAARG
jgi:hypothetical protein